MHLPEMEAFDHHDYLPPCERHPTWKPIRFGDIDLKSGEPMGDDFVLYATYKKPEAHQLTVAKGFSTIAPVCIIYPPKVTIIALQMLGEPERVNASWASLMNGGSRHYIMNETVMLKGMRDHIRLNKPFPNTEFKETWLIHKQATLEHLNPALNYLFLIQFKPGRPQNFYAMLDKSIGTPTLPAWTEFLWKKGEEKKLILKNMANHAVGHNAWIVRTHLDHWQKIISNGLASGEITF